MAFRLSTALIMVLSIPAVLADGWDDFTNNLATDLAPLITLFGEQVTKQFLSESLSMWDSVLFGLAPLGILTAVVSAIRVCDSPSLRAFVGRSQEGPGGAEIELLSSTSDTTVELWNDGGISRVFGKPQILQVIYYFRAEDYEDSDLTLPPNYTAGLYFIDDTSEKNPLTATHRLRSLESTDPSGFVAPNLSINVGIKRIKPIWSYSAIILGGLLQAGVLVFACITVAFPSHFKKNGKPAQVYSLCLFAGGTILLCTGMFICATIIDHATEEIYFRKKPSAVTRSSQPSYALPDSIPSFIYILQPGNQKVGDQLFGAFAGRIQVTDEKHVYIRSVKGKTTEILLWPAVVLTMSAFVTQFVGYRGLHASVTLAQLGATLIMTVIRSMLRTRRPQAKDNLLHDYRIVRNGEQNLHGHELDWFAMKLGNLDELRLLQLKEFEWRQDPKIQRLSRANFPREAAEADSGVLATIPVFSSDRSNPGYGWGQQALMARVRLVHLTNDQNLNWNEPSVRDIAHRLKFAIERTLRVLTGLPTAHIPRDTTSWLLPFESRRRNPLETRSDRFHLRLRHVSNSRWDADLAELEALIGLFTWSFRSRIGPLATCDRPDDFLRVVSVSNRGDSDINLLDLQMYIPRMILSTTTKAYLISPNLALKQSDGRIPADSDIESENPPTLVVSTLSIRHHIATLMAQAIYVSFLSASLRYVTNLGGTTFIMERDPADTNLMFIRNKTVDRLVKVFEESRLGSEDDAYSCIIPEVIRQRKLPTEHNGVELQEALRYWKLPMAKETSELHWGQRGIKLRWDQEGMAGNTLLQLIRDGMEINVARLLITDSWNLSDVWTRAVLVQAIAGRRMQVVRALLMHGNQVDLDNYVGTHALIFVITIWDLDLIELLLKKISDLKRKNIWGICAQDAALSSGNPSSLRLVTYHQGMADTRHWGNHSPLFSAVSDSDPVKLSAVLKERRSQRLPPDSGELLFKHWNQLVAHAARKLRPGEENEGARTILKLLLDGPNGETKKGDITDALNYAMGTQNRELTMALLEQRRGIQKNKYTDFMVHCENSEYAKWFIVEYGDLITDDPDKFNARHPGSPSSP